MRLQATSEGKRARLAARSAWARAEAACERASVARARLVLPLAAARTRAVRATWHGVGRGDESQKGGWSCRDREHSSAVTRIRTWVVSATTRSTNHYTITANAPARAPLQLRGDRPPSGLVGVVGVALFTKHARFVAERMKRRRRASVCRRVSYACSCTPCLR